MKNVIITSVLSLMLAAGASAKTIYVSTDGSESGNGTSWNTSVNDLRIALDKAVKGDVIYMAGGRYAVTSTVWQKEGVDIYGGFAKGETDIANRARPNATVEPWKFTNETVITTTGPGDYRLVDRENKVTWETMTTLDGISFKDYATSNGRVMYMNSYTLFQNCQVVNCSSKGGTVVYVETNVTVRDCYFSKINTNDPTAGAVALQVRGCQGAYHPGNIVEGCLFEENLAPSMSVWNTVAQESDQDGTWVRNNVFRNNKACCLNVSNGWDKRYLKITGNLFEGNASAEAGSVYMGGGSFVYTDFSSNIIRNNINTTDQGGNWSNSIISATSKVQVSNCLIVNNSSEKLLMNVANSSLYNNTIANNKGSIYIGSNYPRVMNTIMVNNEATHKDVPIYPVAESSVEYCATDVAIDPEQDDVYLIENVIDAAPFVQPTAFVGAATDAEQIKSIENADFSLNAISKCLNAGAVTFEDDYFMTPEWVNEFMAKDIAGNDRMVDGKINIGAYQGGKNVGFAQIGEEAACNVTVDANTIYVSADKDGSAVLYSVNGSQLDSKAIVGGNAVIPVSQKGLYLVRTVTGSQAKTFKVVIK